VVENTPQHRVVYRGLTEETAERLLKENVFTNKGFTDTTVNPWNACQPLDEERRDTYHNLMAISLPEGAKGLYVAEQEMMILQRDLTLKCIGVAMFDSVKIAPDGTPRNIRMFAMEMKP
jgi:hypothetical protein